jgi:hypothetical protein
MASETPPQQRQASARETGSRASGVTYVDPRAPRFGQALTTLGLVAAIAFDQPWLVAVVAVVLVTAVASGWRLDLYAALWRRLRPIVGEPESTEPAAPHRFARVVGAALTTLATFLVVAGFPLAALAVAGVVAALAGLAATTGICVGCRFYRQVAFVRRLGIL